MRILSKIAFHICVALSVIQLWFYPEDLSKASFFGILAIINYIYYLDAGLPKG